MSLPPGLIDDPRVDQWVAFPSPGRVSIRTGKVEIGRGVLTALPRIAAEELDVAPGRIAMQSGDWELYPMPRVSEVPEVSVELVNPSADVPSLGVGEASGGPTVAAIGNAVARAPGARSRDLPLTRERVMGALLTG